MAKCFIKIIVNYLIVKSLKFRCKNLNKISYVCINSFFYAGLLGRV